MNFDHIFRRFILTQSFVRGWGNPLHLQEIFRFRREKIAVRDECVKLISKENSIEILIPRDPKMFVKKMIVKNITNEPVLFNYHLYNLQVNYSIHFELRSFNENLTYFVIYQFDQIKVSTKMAIDGWNLLCLKNQDNIYTFYLNNNQTLNHRTILFGIRELNVNEKQRYCANQTVDQPQFNQSMIFSSNYEIRTYASGCFHLDENNKWQSNGLTVIFYFFFLFHVFFN